VVLVRELFAQYLATWHTTPLGLLVKVVTVLLVVGCLSLGNCFGYLLGILSDWVGFGWRFWKS
jgi:hypothetical protein